MSDLQGNPSRPVSASEFTRRRPTRDPAPGRPRVDPDPRRVHVARVPRPRARADLRELVGARCVHGRGRRAGELRRRRRGRPLADRLPEPLRRAARAPQLLPPPGNEALRDVAGEGRALLPVPVSRLGVRPGRRAPGDAACSRRRRESRPTRRTPSTCRASARSTRRTTGSIPHASTPGAASCSSASTRRRRRCSTSSATCRRGWPGTASTSTAPTARRVLDRGQLEARRRELHGVLPPALGAPGARQGFPAQVALPLAGRRDVHGLLHDSDRGEYRRRGLARAPRAPDAETRTARAHGSRGSSRTSR